MEMQRTQILLHPIQRLALYPILKELLNFSIAYGMRLVRELNRQPHLLLLLQTDNRQPHPLHLLRNSHPFPGTADKSINLSGLLKYHGSSKASMLGDNGILGARLPVKTSVHNEREKIRPLIELCHQPPARGLLLQELSIVMLLHLCSITLLTHRPQHQLRLGRSSQFLIKPRQRPRKVQNLPNQVIQRVVVDWEQPLGRQLH
jgi:hypothetical protein